MTRSSPTPGPWHMSSTHNGWAYDIGAENGANIALVSGPGENGADEFKANARLIAAAPELLKALRELAAEALKNMVGGKIDLIDNAYFAIIRAGGIHE